MSVNSSSSSNDSLLHSNISSIDNDLPLYMYCLTTPPSSHIFITLMVTTIFLLLPLCIFIIYHGLQQWRQKTSSAETMSHSDSFTYHMVTMELIGLIGGVISICSIYTKNLNTSFMGYILLSFTWFGEIFFHVLTCVERYLAVVHPVTYLSLRRERGTRMRNITIGCVWLLSVVGTSLVMVEHINIILTFFLPVLSISVVSFCSLSVLRVLIRPGPGEQDGGKDRVDESKQRAFYTIMAILGVLMLRFFWDVIRVVLYMMGKGVQCVTIIGGLCFNMPSVLVLPLLFLHRAEKLVCCKNNIQ